MSIEREVQIYTYTLNIINLALKIKFPCKVYLQHSGNPITTEVPASSPNKFIFNQEVTLKNETDKQYIEVLVQLVTDKGAKYVGGVLRFVEKELIGSEGQVIVVPVAKCLDSEASCEARVQQVATSRVIKKESGKRKYHQKTEFGHDTNLKVGWSPSKFKAHEHETKSEFNIPLSMAQKKDRFGKEPTVGGPINMKKRPEMSFEREAGQSAVGGMSAIEFQVYKEGYNKLKDKYRKQAQNARTELNKRMALESNENNLKLQVMRYKLKTEELQKTLGQKNQKLKEFTEAISNFQKKELDIKYMKQEIENKNYSIKNLEETIKALTKDNSELKNLQNLRSINEQQTIKNLKDDLERVKKELQSRENQLTKEIKLRNDTITKRDYQLHSRGQELQRSKYMIEDLQKTISNKIFQWQKIQQSDKSAAKSKQDELKAKIAKLKEDKTGLDQKIRELEQKLEEKKNETIRLEYDKKVLAQNYDSLFKEVEELKATREKYLELVREHKMVGEEKTQIEKSKERQARLKESQLEDLNQKLSQLSQSNKKTIKELEEKLKNNQIKAIELESQGELLKNQLDKSKRQNDSLTKENGELRNQLKDSKTDSKEKEQKLLALTNQLAESKNKYKQGDYTSKLQQDRMKSEIEKLTRLLQEEQTKTAELSETVNKQELELNKSKMESQFKEDKAAKEMSYAKEKHSNLEGLKADLETQLAAATSSIANLKTHEKTLNQKIQNLELEGIKSRQMIQRLKKDIKILEEKLQNSDNNFKGKTKELTDQLEVKEALDKQIAAKDGQISQLKNELNKESNENTRNQKIVEILQGDLAKGKEEQARLNSVIKTREKSEEELREEIKKQKEEYVCMYQWPLRPKQPLKLAFNSYQGLRAWQPG